MWDKSFVKTYMTVRSSFDPNLHYETGDVVYMLDSNKLYLRVNNTWEVLEDYKEEQPFKEIRCEYCGVRNPATNYHCHACGTPL